MDRRALAAAVFALRAAGFALLAAVPAPRALYAGSRAAGFGVGNVITLPPLLAHEEFGARSYARIFALVQAATQLGVAAGPALVGLVRDASGYPLALGALAALDALAAAVVLAGRRRRPPV